MAGKKELSRKGSSSKLTRSTNAPGTSDKAKPRSTANTKRPVKTKAAMDAKSRPAKSSATKAKAPGRRRSGKAAGVAESRSGAVTPTEKTSNKQTRALSAAASARKTATANAKGAKAARGKGGKK